MLVIDNIRLEWRATWLLLSIIESCSFHIRSHSIDQTQWRHSSTTLVIYDRTYTTLMCLCWAYMLPCCHHNIPHFCSLKKISLCNLLAARNILSFSLRRSVTESESFMTTTRIHSFIHLNLEERTEIFSPFVQRLRSFSSINSQQCLRFFPSFSFCGDEAECGKRNNAVKVNSQRKRNDRHNKTGREVREAQRQTGVLNIFMIIMEIYQKFVAVDFIAPAQSHVNEVGGSEREEECKAV